LVLGSDQLTLPLALAKLGDSSYRIPEAVGLAAGVLAMIPLLVLFGLFFRQIRTALSDWVVS
jgi:ABC-type glycerol-3-phosphate transport system permease component